jgi:hypothetical protein
MQTACEVKGLCEGGSSFDQLRFLRESLKINDGLTLNHGYISFTWLNIMFWRTFVALMFHFLQLLCLQSLCLKLGFLSNKTLQITRDDIKDRPPEESVTVHGFIKQPFYHKAYAANDHQKKKYLRRTRVCFCFFIKPKKPQNVA